MSLLDKLFEGPVKILDLDHEQYGEAAATPEGEMIFNGRYGPVM